MVINEKSKKEICGYVLNNFRKNNPIYDDKTGIYTLIMSSEIVGETGRLEEVKEVVSFTKNDIDNAYEKTKNIYKNIKDLYEAGITLRNAKNMREEARACKNSYDTYKTLYLNAPIKEGESAFSTCDYWNHLVSKGVIDSSCKNRYSDYVTLYSRIYRLIKLVELGAPNVIINNELSLITSSFVKKDCFISFDEDKNQEKNLNDKDKLILDDEKEIE